VVLTVDGSGMSTPCGVVIVALLVDSVARLFAQRRPLFALDTFMRWVSVVTAAICSCAAVANAHGSPDDVYAALSLTITGAHLLHAHKIGLPIGVRVAGHAVLAVAVAFVVKASAAPTSWCALAGLAVTIALRHRAPKLPLVATSASALLWLATIAAGGCAAMLVKDHDHAPLAATIVCALALVIAGELSRSVDTLFAGFAFLVICA